jgi:hypothetical protein
VFLRPGAEAPLRVPGAPLVWAGLALDRLTTGWNWDLAAGAVDVDSPPAGAEVVAWDGVQGSPSEAEWQVDGSSRSQEEQLELVVERWPNPYDVRAGNHSVVGEAFGFCDAFESGMRGVNDETLFRTLYDLPGKSAFLVGAGAVLGSTGTPGQIQLTGGEAPMATMLVDGHAATWRSLSPWVSVEDAGDGALHPAGLVGMTLHVLYTPADGRAWDPYAHTLVTP